MSWSYIVSIVWHSCFSAVMTETKEPSAHALRTDPRIDIQRRQLMYV